MSSAPLYPSLYEINTRVWLNTLSRRAGKAMTLADIDDATLDRLAERGFDWVWLLSVWRTGAASRAVSRSRPEWRDAFRAVLPDLVDDDISGSGFAISAYDVDPSLGGRAALAEFRAGLAKRGIRLMLDFVANHTALDHPWVQTHRDFYIEGDGGALAHGRDPNFPGWPDTLQLDYANPALQAAMKAELLAIADQCDGVRCDMAMLLLPQVFQRTWGRTPAPFWPGAIEAVRLAHRDFTFLAEVYWDLEGEMLQQGFDYCYDKRLYDRLRGGDGSTIRDHLAAGLDYQNHLARFLENHDEPRAATIFPLERHRAAAVVTYLSPGLRFFHQGQLEGFRSQLPTHLCRAPTEQQDEAVAAFYDRLLSVIGTDDAFRAGAWTPIAPQPAWSDNPTWRNFIACTWAGSNGIRYVVAVNDADHQGQCRLPLPFDDGRRRLVDVMGDEIYIRDGSEMASPGLYLDLGAWRSNVFRLDRLGS
ncbi:MAG: alpha-amylase family glycosyl hydrolase [Reyranellaceae bacterium]